MEWDVMKDGFNLVDGWEEEDTTAFTLSQLEEMGFETEAPLEETIYIFTNGCRITGEFNCGTRTVEHRTAEAFTKTDRYDGSKFWEEVMLEMGLVMVVPENHKVYIHPHHETTEEQDELIEALEELGFETEEFE